MRTGPYNQIKVAYLHGRPGPHPMHAKFAEATDAKFHFIDFRMRWQDRNKSILYRLISSLLCAFTFPDRKKYDIFLVDNLHFMPVIMKMLGLLRKDQKIVAHMGSHTLYFLYAHRFSRLTEWLHVQALKRYDALICEGKMAEDLVKIIVGPKHPPLYYVYMGIPAEHFPKDYMASPLPENKNVLFMGNGPGSNRLWYKGLDIMIEAIDHARQQEPDLTFTVVGEWEPQVLESLLLKYDAKTREAINFHDHTTDLREYVRKASLYLHCARGEAFGITILIAMALGVPALVSEWTGAKEVVKQVDTQLIAPLDSKAIAEKILWYYKLSPDERDQLSKKSRAIALRYSEENTIADFKKVFAGLIADLK